MRTRSLLEWLAGFEEEGEGAAISLSETLKSSHTKEGEEEAALGLLQDGTFLLRVMDQLYEGALVSSSQEHQQVCLHTHIILPCVCMRIC